MSGTPRREIVARAVREHLAERSLEWLAEATGISAEDLEPLLAGTAAFDVDQLSSVSVALGVSLSELV